MLGTPCNQYRITAKLGAGGMGEVFRARDTRLNREVAIKLLPKEFASDPDRLRRFEQETKSLAALNHPNVLTIFDTGVQEGAPYLVSELLEGKTLREEVGTSNAGLPVRKAMDYAIHIAQGLATAHNKGIIHRDLKPENLFITKDGRVKILDFGLAKLHENFKSQISNLKSAEAEAPTLVDSTQPGMVLGTPAYMSPEQVRGEPADHRSDIFAFGCLLYEMLSGTRAFRRDTPVESMNAVLREDPPELAPSNRGIPPALERIARRCLEKQADNRFQSAKDLAFAVENAVGATPLVEPGSGGSPRKPLPDRLLSMLPWSVSAALAIALGVLYWRSSLIPSGTAAAGLKTLRRFDLALPQAARPQANGDLFTPAISPDGKKIASGPSVPTETRFHPLEIRRWRDPRFGGRTGAGLYLPKPNLLVVQNWFSEMSDKGP